MRAAVKYGRALNRGIELADYIRKVNEAGGRDYEIELSVDETDQPTTLAEHYIIADQCLGRGMKLVSLAPRFVGTLEKGVDYIGDVTEFEKSLARPSGDRGAAGAVQAEPALGLGQAFDLHVARAGDGRAVPREDGGHFVSRSAPGGGPARSASCSATICEFSRGRYDVDKATYHVHATLEMVAAAGGRERRPPAGADLSRVLGGRAGGRGLHGTGPADSALHVRLGADRRRSSARRSAIACKSHPDTYTEILADAFRKASAGAASGMLKLSADNYRPLGKTGLSCAADRVRLQCARESLPGDSRCGEAGDRERVVRACVAAGVHRHGGKVWGGAGAGGARPVARQV